MTTSWAGDPELVATFRAEMTDRLATLRAGVARLGVDPAPRPRVDRLLRDAHTVKGSARMLGLDDVVTLAHRVEDVLCGIRDGRLGPADRPADVLLEAIDVLDRAVPGSSRLPPDEPLPETVDVAGAVGGQRPASTVRVPVPRLHGLLDAVGEAELAARRLDRQTTRLLAAAEGLAGLASDTADPRAALDVTGRDRARELDRWTRDLTRSAGALRGQAEALAERVAAVRVDAMGLAMVPLRRVVAAFGGLVASLAATTGREVRLELDGEDVELDTRVLDAVADALRHLVTNAVDHGVEPAEVRRVAGKPAVATVRVGARAAGATVVVEVADDGRGIDEQAVRTRAVATGLVGEADEMSPAALHALLFSPGFSTRSEATRSSGRGVGLDVVQTAVRSLGGVVEVDSVPGQGTRFVLTLPVALGVLRALIARVGHERYALPVATVAEVVRLADHPPTTLAGHRLLTHRERTVPLLDLGEALAHPAPTRPAGNPGVAVLVRPAAGGLLGWVVDGLDGEREVVVKDLGGFLEGRMALRAATPRGASAQTTALVGATIDEDGRVLLLLDVRALAGRGLGLGDPRVAPSYDPVVDRTPGRPGPRPRVLVVEDSVGVRELERVILSNAGYGVLTAVDGMDGARRLGSPPVDLVVSDVEMPGMDGFALTRTIRRTHGWEDVPVVIMTSRDDAADRRAGLEAGATAYLLKADFNQDDLVGTVRRLIGR